MRIIVGVIRKSASDMLFWLFIAFLVADAGNTYSERMHGYVWTDNVAYTESNRQLKNPNRGFYTMYGFSIEDVPQEFKEPVEKRLKNDGCTLSLIQINLRAFKDKALTEQGLTNLKALFHELESWDKQYIIRFLYDWNGKAKETEPEDIQRILNHMEQIKEVLNDYRHIIFTFQGVFVGDCGEMHGSNHMSEESMTALLQQFFRIAPEGSYLSVRTPQHWRILTGLSETVEFGSTELSKWLGLYNDGIMGTNLDTGTYGTASREEAGPTGKWSREEELAFQSELCKLVPNGGEVIIENPLNDFESAVENLAKMHVTYLNQGYDQKVLNKWAGTTVTEEGCYYGMDGLTYMERHLGYRLLIADTALSYDFWEDTLNIEIALQNVGFAPLYKEPEKWLTICRKETGAIMTVPVEAELRSLAGGTETEQLLTISEVIALDEFAVGTYEVYFTIQDADSGWRIELANEQEQQTRGYKIGEIRVDAIPDLTELRQEYFAPENIWKMFMGEER